MKYFLNFFITNCPEQTDCKNHSKNLKKKITLFNYWNNDIEDKITRI